MVPVSRYLSVLFSSFLVLALSTAALSQMKTTEAGSAATSESASTFSKEAYVVENFSSKMVAEADGTGTREITAAIKVLADAGVKQFAVLNFTYTSANEVVDVEYVRVRKPDGSVVTTPEYNIQDMPADVTRIAPIYSDIHEKHVAVKGLGVGDVLEYKTRFKVVKPQVPGQFWFEFSFDDTEIVKDGRLEISVPKDRYVKVVSPARTPKVREEGTRRLYVWAYSNLKRKDTDEKELPRRTTPNPDVQVSSFANWDEIGRWYDGLQQEPIKVTPAIQAKATELVKGLKSDDEKIRAIYNYVSLHFHYIGLSFGIGRYQPHAADDILSNEYGDCKDKHTLMASLLRAAGYEAWPALVHSTRKLDPDVPSPAQFDHVITVVPSGDKLTWLDTTPEVAPFGVLMNVLRGKKALAIPPNKPSVLMEIPQNLPFVADQKFRVEAKLGADGVLKGHIEHTTVGQSEVMFRSAFREVPEAQWKELMQQISYRLGYGGDVSNVEVTRPEAIDKPFKVSYDYLRKDYSDWENKQITPPLPPFGVEGFRDSGDKKPTEPIFLGDPGVIEYWSKLELPPGYKTFAPKSIDLVEPFAEYHTAHALEKGVLTSSRRLVIKKREVDIPEWQAFVKFTKALSDDEFKYIHLNGGSEGVTGSLANVEDLDKKFREGTEAMQNRDLHRAQELFEQVIAGEPKYHGAHFNLGLVFGMQNRSEDALREFRKEEEVTPDDPRAYQAVASFLMYGSRRKEAEEEWRKLLKVDSKNRDAVLNLSQLLAEDGKYNESVELLAGAVQQSPDSRSLKLALGLASISAGKSEQGIKILREVADSGEAKATDPETLTEIAWALASSQANLDLAKSYSEKAVAQLESESVAAETPEDGARVCQLLSKAWDILGWVDYMKGDVIHGESLVRAAWLLSQKGVAGYHLGQIYENQGKPKEAAHLYELALATSEVPAFRLPGQALRFSKEYRMDGDEVRSRYKKLTGALPFTSTRRLPDGQWTVTPSEELSRARETKLQNTGSLKGSAEFLITFAQGKPEKVRFLSGDSQMKAMNDALANAKYKVETPAGSTAKLIRRAVVSCYPGSGCSAVLVLPEWARNVSFQ